MPIKGLLLEGKKAVDGALDKYLPRKGKLSRAMRYSVFAGGKRFRPMLCMAAAKALGKDPKRVLPIACAIEMIHTYTLIHDDLPAMDNSDFRRGKLTCHKKFGEATAVLAGDALNALAFEILARETKNSKVICEISRALLQVVAGQMLDLEHEGKRVGLQTLKTIHRKKTAALLLACVRSPAIYLGTTAKGLRALTSYAEHLGIAFQIADDILDATSTRKKLGKPVKADIKKGFPYIAGLERSRKMAEQEKNRAVVALKIFGKKAYILREIAEFVVVRKK
ncbi:MAG: farnesyl diphosphate synthase [Candidatus Margulisiibacteriota bacterium]